MSHIKALMAHAITLMVSIAISAVFHPAFAQAPEGSNPPYQIEVAGEGENPPQLEFTINFENGLSLNHTVQGNGTTPFENPGYGRIISVTFHGVTLPEGEQAVTPIGNPGDPNPPSYRWWWWFDANNWTFRPRAERVLT
jgi:hypothetical protein